MKQEDKENTSSLSPDKAAELPSEIYFKGAPVSEGIAIGIPVFLSDYEEENIPEFPISTGEVEGEIARYRKALSSSREDLKKLQVSLAEEGSEDVVSILDTHIQMLDDPLMTTDMEKKIREMLKNTESVFQTVITDYESRFSKTLDSFFQQRLADVKDLSQRVLRNLCFKLKVNLKEIPPNSIVFAKELIPSDTASIQASRVSAFVTENGGGTSHAALIARAKGIPYVASIDVDLFQKAEGKYVIVDGLTGDIILNPSDDTLKKYEALRSRLTAQYQHLEKERDFTCETVDGYPISLQGNVNQLNDIELVHHHKGAGIGLFRSEFLFFQDATLFEDEQRQQIHYEQFIEKAGDLPLIIRVLDIGGDKLPEKIFGFKKEPNLGLGCRGVRFLLTHPQIFRTQLRALLKAAVKGSVKLLLPLVSDIQELREIKAFIKGVEKELEKESALFKSDISLGCMLEVPSAVLICDVIAQEADFLAVGTNDLTQYTLGIDRHNFSMSDFYSPTHPSVIRMIKLAILESKRKNIPISICGEIASNPLFIPLLLGLGVRTFSCAPRFIPLIKRTIRQYTIVGAYKLAEHVLQLKTSTEINQFLMGELQHGGEIGS